MVTSDPQKIHDELNKIGKTGHSTDAPIEFYVPYVTFLGYSITDKEVIQRYTALRRFVFLKLTEHESNQLRNQYKWHLLGLGHYRDHRGNPLSITDREMRAFMAICADSRIDYEIWPTVDDLEINELVTLKTTPFAGWEARILECRRTKHGNSFTVGIDVIGSTMLLRIKDLKESDIERRYAPDRKKQEYRLIEWIKSNIKSVIDRRLSVTQSSGNVTQSEAKNLNHTAKSPNTDPDADILNKIWDYRHLAVTSPTVRAHFLAMLLICAKLRRDPAVVKSMRQRVDRELRDIATDPNFKRPTDAWASLQVAMYMATKDPAYRDAVKDYERRYRPKSALLHSLIQIIRRFDL